MLYSEIPEWLQEFRENLVDDEIPEHGDSHASSSHEVSLEPTFKRRVDLCKHSRKDRNCEICQRTKITRAPCRRRNGGAVPRAEIFGDLITADHKVLSENCESRNHHRYAIVVQDSATQWIQAFPYQKQKLHKKLKEACKSSWSQIGSQKSFTLTNLWNSAKLVKIFPGIIARLHHTDQKHMGLLKEQCAEERKAPLLYCCNQVCKKIGGHEYYHVAAKDQSRIHQFGKKVLPGLFFGYALYAGRIWKGDILVADIEELETMDASEIYSKRLDAKEVTFPIADGRIKPLGGDQDLRTSTLVRHRPIRGESQNQKSLFHHLMTRFRMPVKQLMISGPCQETSYTFSTLNQESNFSRREKNHSLFH